MTTAILVVIMLVGGFLWFRNYAVYSYRKALINKIHHLNQANIMASWEWRYDEFDTISYYEMLLQFWRPLDSFYCEGFPEKEATQ